MGRKKLVRLECDRPNCEEELVIEEGSPKTAESSQWKRVYIMENEARFDEAPNLQFQKVLCLSCYNKLKEAVGKIFTEE